MMINRQLIGWIIGIITGVVALALSLNQLTFDSELLSSEQRLMISTNTSDRRILEQMVDAQRLMIAQQQQQFLTLRRELVDQQLGQMRQKYDQATPHQQALLLGRIKSLESKLDEIDKSLQNLMLKAKVPDVEPEW